MDERAALLRPSEASSSFQDVPLTDARSARFRTWTVGERWVAAIAAT